MTSPEAAVTEAFRLERGRAVATLVRMLGDIDAAEEAVQDAFVRALEVWPRDGVPPNAAGWIVTTAKNRAIDVVRREGSRQSRYEGAARLGAGVRNLTRRRASRSALISRSRTTSCALCSPAATRRWGWRARWR
ncbi:MAG: hypothetical protein NVV57_04210 [Demequina sp.]|nr:hypothetical protein [Demequina sp.]